MAETTKAVDQESAANRVFFSKVNNVSKTLGNVSGEVCTDDTSTGTEDLTSEEWSESCLGSVDMKMVTGKNDGRETEEVKLGRMSRETRFACV